MTDNRNKKIKPWSVVCLLNNNEGILMDMTSELNKLLDILEKSMTSDRMTSCQSTHMRTVDDIIALKQISNVKQKIELVGVEPEQEKRKVSPKMILVFFLDRSFQQNMYYSSAPTHHRRKEYFIRTEENKYPWLNMDSCHNY